MHKECKVLLVFKGKQELLEEPVVKEPLDYRAFKVYKEFKDLPVLVFKVSKECKDLKVYKVLLEELVSKVLQEVREYKVLKAYKVFKVLKA